MTRCQILTNGKQCDSDAIGTREFFLGSTSGRGEQITMAALAYCCEEHLKDKRMGGFQRC